MNKLVAILGIIILFTVGALFFFAGFFTGSTFPTNGIVSDNADTETKKISAEINTIVNPDTLSLTEKVSKLIDYKQEQREQQNEKTPDKNTNASGSGNTVSMDDLLREIISQHTVADSCSPQQTKQDISTPIQAKKRSIEGRQIVFIGYFANQAALEIQKLLTQKGYKVHVEHSKSAPNESFVFCGPFFRLANAENLLSWLKKHDFAEARIIKIAKDGLEETIYSSATDELPQNAEKDIPEVQAAIQTQKQQDEEAKKQQEQKAQEQHAKQQQELLEQHKKMLQQQQQMQDQQQQMLQHQQAIQQHQETQRQQMMQQMYPYQQF